MIKKLKVSAHATRESLISEEIHFRLCHVCLNLNESEEEIVECQNCQCPFTAEDSWDVAGFDPLGEKSPPTEELLKDDDFMPTDAYARKARRLMGLSVRW